MFLCRLKVGCCRRRQGARFDPVILWSIPLIGDAGSNPATEMIYGRSKVAPLVLDE